MFLQSLPTSFNVTNEPTPPVYSDHFLFSEKLQRPYECPEHSSGLGLLITGKGNCDFYVNGIKNRVNQDTVLFVNRSSQLAIRIAEKDAAPTLLFFNSRLPDLIQQSLIHGDEMLSDEPAYTLPFDFSYLERMHHDPDLHQTISSLIALGNNCSSFASLKADIIIRNLFENLLKENQDAFRLSKNIHAMKAATRLEIFKRVSGVKDWIDENLHSNITLEEMATMAAMNSQHFLRMFRQIYHITPHQWLIESKLKRAKHLLDATQQTVTEICHAIGFESIFSFSILFKKRFGVAPTHFRKA
jgi:AraC family transcriptional regulator